MSVDERKLARTTDAKVWADEFMAEFGGRMEDVDTGLMIGWFANFWAACQSANEGPVIGITESAIAQVVEDNEQAFSLERYCAAATNLLDLLEAPCTARGGVGDNGPTRRSVLDAIAELRRLDNLRRGVG